MQRIACEDVVGSGNFESYDDVSKNLQLYDGFSVVIESGFKKSTSKLYRGIYLHFIVKIRFRCYKYTLTFAFSNTSENIKPQIHTLSYASAKIDI